VLPSPKPPSFGPTVANGDSAASRLARVLACAQPDRLRASTVRSQPFEVGFKVISRSALMHTHGDRMVSQHTNMKNFLHFVFS
jgi:hypothetical protein